LIVTGDEDKLEWVERVLDVWIDFGDEHYGAEQREENLALWRDARADAIEALQEVIANVRATDDPDAVRVEVVLKSIVMNLTERPETPQAVAELRRYIEDDDVITAAEEVPPEYGALDLRAPLLAALANFEA
jgi:hypothetical protein